MLETYFTILAEIQCHWLNRSSAQVEQVLETYFMSVDSTYNRLQILAEIIEDTEDLVKFDMDMQRNRFIEVCV